MRERLLLLPLRTLELRILLDSLVQVAFRTCPWRGPQGPGLEGGGCRELSRAEEARHLPGRHDRREREGLGLITNGDGAAGLLGRTHEELLDVGQRVNLGLAMLGVELERRGEDRVAVSVPLRREHLAIDVDDDDEGGGEDDEVASRDELLDDGVELCK